MSKKTPKQRRPQKPQEQDLALSMSGRRRRVAQTVVWLLAGVLVLGVIGSGLVSLFG